MDNPEALRFLEDMDELVFTRITPDEKYQVIRGVVHSLLTKEPEVSKFPPRFDYGY